MGFSHLNSMLTVSPVAGNLSNLENPEADDLPDQVWSQYGMLQKMWELPGSAEAVKVPAFTNSQ